MKTKTYLVTGGAGFLGASLVRRLVAHGHHVRVLDNELRGRVSRLKEIADRIEVVHGDIRDAAVVRQAMRGVESVCHLAFVNGTEYFYSRPDLVLDVGVKGMINILDACIQEHVGELILASSSEVYHAPSTVPTNETAPLVIPDPLNPRYSYAGGKIISELMALHYGKKYFDRVIIFRPHNVYGPDMGTEHVIPQFILRMLSLLEDSTDPLPFPIQGSGHETRAFVFISDLIDGVLLLLEHGQHLGIYHVGTEEEITIGEVACMVGRCFNRQITVIPGHAPEGGTPRRCPDISKLASFGYQPRVRLEEGLPRVAHWYEEQGHRMPCAEEGVR